MAAAAAMSGLCEGKAFSNSYLPPVQLLAVFFPLHELHGRRSQPAAVRGVLRGRIGHRAAASSTLGRCWWASVVQRSVRSTVYSRRCLH